MNLFVTQFRYALKTVWMDKRPIIFRFGVFILMTFILGSAFNSSFSKKDIAAVEIGYVSADQGKGATEYFRQLVAIPEFNGIAHFRTVDSFAAGQKLVEDGDLGALLYVDKNFSTAMAAKDGHATVGVYLKKYSGINYPIIRSVVDSYNSGANAVWAIREMGGTVPATAAGGKAVSLNEVSSGRDMTGFSYYAVGMLLFLLLHGAEYGSFGGMSEDFLGAVGRRARLTLLKPWQQYLGKILAFSLVTFAQGAIYVATTAAFFHVHWGQHIGLTLTAIFVFGAMAIALGTAAMTLTREEKKTKAILQVCMLGFTFLAGGFVVTSFGLAERFSPSYYAREALFTLMFGEGTQAAVRNIGIITAIAAGFAVLSMVASRRKLA